MKQLLLFSFLFTGSAIYAQQDHAIITTKTIVVAPEGDEPLPPMPTSGNGEEIKVVRFGGEGETKSVTWVKNDLVKTLVTNDMGRTTTIRDNSKKMTTTLMEMMGTKRGFYSTDEEQAQMDKSMDSMMKTRQPGVNAPAAVTGTEIATTDETKKIAGFNCKKVFVINTRSNGKKDSSIVWYTPDVKLPNINYTGGVGGMFGRNAAPKGFDKIDGFVMSYSMTMNRGRKMTVEVLKLETEKDVADKEFEISKDFDVKPMKDMMNGGAPGSFQVRIGG